MRADFIHIETVDGSGRTLGFIDDKAAYGAALTAAQADPAMVRVIVANRSSVRVFHNKRTPVGSPAAATSRRKTATK